MDTLTMKDTVKQGKGQLKLNSALLKFTHFNEKNKQKTFRILLLKLKKKLKKKKGTYCGI